MTVFSAPGQSLYRPLVHAAVNEAAHTGHARRDFGDNTAVYVYRTEPQKFEAFVGGRAGIFYGCEFTEPEKFAGIDLILSGLAKA